MLADQAFGGQQAIGWLNVGMSGGALAAMAVVNRLASRRRPARVLLAVMTWFTVCTALVGLTGVLPLTVVSVTVAGAATLIAEVMAVTLLQRAAPQHLVARVFGVCDQLNIGAIAVGSLLAGPATHRPAGPRRGNRGRIDRQSGSVDHRDPADARAGDKITSARTVRTTTRGDRAPREAGRAPGRLTLRAVRRSRWHGLCQIIRPFIRPFTGLGLPGREPGAADSRLLRLTWKHRSTAPAKSGPPTTQLRRSVAGTPPERSVRT